MENSYNEYAIDVINRIRSTTIYWIREMLMFKFASKTSYQAKYRRKDGPTDQHIRVDPETHHHLQVIIKPSNSYKHKSKDFYSRFIRQRLTNVYHGDDTTKICWCGI